MSREGRYYLPGAPTGRRETIITSAIEASPQYVLRLPGPGWTPFLAAVLTAAFFMLLTVKFIDRGTRVRRACRGTYFAFGCGAAIPQPLGPVRHWRRHPIAHLRFRTRITCLVGNCDPAAGRGLALSGLRFLLPLPLDGCSPSLAASTRLAGDGLGLASAALLVGSSIAVYAAQRVLSASNLAARQVDAVDCYGRRRFVRLAWRSKHWVIGGRVCGRTPADTQPWSISLRLSSSSSWSRSW